MRRDDERRWVGTRFSRLGPGAARYSPPPPPTSDNSGGLGNITDDYSLASDDKPSPSSTAGLPDDSSYGVGDANYDMPGYTSYDDYVSQTYGPGDTIYDAYEQELATPTDDQLATQYSQQQANAMAPVDYNPFGNIGGAITDPLGTISNYFDKPTNQLGFMLGMAGVPGAGSILDTVANKNMEMQALDRAKADQGIPGYSYGMVDGQPYSIGFNALGHQVMTGTVPDWFDINVAEHMQSYQKGFDTDGNALTGGNSKFSADGYLTTPFGYDVATHADVTDLANNYGLSYDAALSAVDGAMDGTNVDVYGNSIGLSEALDNEVDKQTAAGVDAEGNPTEAGSLSIGYDEAEPGATTGGVGDAVSGVSVSDVEGVVGVDYDSDEISMDNGDGDGSSSSSSSDTDSETTAETDDDYDGSDDY